MQAISSKIFNESNHMKIAIIKWKILIILLSKIHIFFMKIGKIENNNNQIPLSLTTVSPCKNKLKTWINFSLYFDHQKVRFNE